LKALDVVCAQYLDKSVETLKADRANRVVTVSYPKIKTEPAGIWQSPWGDHTGTSMLARYRDSDRKSSPSPYWSCVMIEGKN
jgi:hypothetical protein